MAVTLEDVASDIRVSQMLSDLHETLSISNMEWNSWERKFIGDVAWKDARELTAAQEAKVRELWEKI